MNMKIETVELSNRRKDLDYKSFVKRSATENDFDTLIETPTIFTFEGVPIIAYLPAPESTHNLVQHLRTVEYQKSTRTSGLVTHSRVFGYQPRVVMRRDFCTATSLAQTNPSVNDALTRGAVAITELYKTQFPDVVSKHGQLTDKVLPEWRMPDSVFTSGIINKNNPLKYHYDAGNFNDVCSCMLGYKSAIDGGYLAMPEFGIALAIDNKTISMFDGQKILHGVTPIHQRHAESYRYTVVYYSLKGMWKCEPLTAEIARIRKLKQNRELKRAGLLDTAVVDQHGVKDD